MITQRGEAPPAYRGALLGATGLRRNWRASWAGRGWWGGLIAMGLAAMGQQILITQNDAPTASRYYILAVVLIIVALTHPDLSWLRRRAQAAPPPSRRPHCPRSRCAGRGRRRRRNNAAPPDPSLDPRWPGCLTRWVALRARLGWRLTAGGLDLTAHAGGGAATLILQQDITDPRGGWLWAGGAGWC